MDARCTNQRGPVRSEDLNRRPGPSEPFKSLRIDSQRKGTSTKAVTRRRHEEEWATILHPTYPGDIEGNPHGGEVCSLSFHRCDLISFPLAIFEYPLSIFKSSMYECVCVDVDVCVCVCVCVRLSCTVVRCMTRSERIHSMPTTPNPEHRP
jgi:hypothetical protein